MAHIENDSIGIVHSDKKVWLLVEVGDCDRILKGGENASLQLTPFLSIRQIFFEF